MSAHLCRAFGGEKKPDWGPDIEKASSAFLVTWQVEDVQPPKLGRKPWKIPDFAAGLSLL